MRVLLDACVLFPSVLRELLIGVAGQGYFTPLWSPRILDEWRFAAQKNSPEVGATAAIEIALLTANWPDATITPDPAQEASLYLPDENDIHVLAAAIAGNAAAILTANTSDFPTRILGQHGLLRRHPDEFLLEYAHAAPSEFDRLLTHVHTKAETLYKSPINKRKMLQKSGLPRLAKHCAR